MSYLVEGLAGYDPALRLALASVVNGRPEPGEVRVASTEVSDPAAFARVQAGLLEAGDATDEGYSRNNGGRFAESAEFFNAAVARNRDNPGQLAEALANQGLQLSNLGNFRGAERLFEQAGQQIARRDGVTQRLLRNYRAINLLNQGKSTAALEVLSEDVAPAAENFEEDALREGVINQPLAAQINRENRGLQRIGALDPGLSAAERATILDGQAAIARGNFQSPARQAARSDYPAQCRGGADRGSAGRPRGVDRVPAVRNPDGARAHRGGARAQRGRRRRIRPGDRRDQRNLPQFAGPARRQGAQGSVSGPRRGCNRCAGAV